MSAAIAAFVAESDAKGIYLFDERRVLLRWGDVPAIDEAAIVAAMAGGLATVAPMLADGLRHQSPSRDVHLFFESGRLLVTYFEPVVEELMTQHPGAIISLVSKEACRRFLAALDTERG